LSLDRLGTDGAASYSPAISKSRKERLLSRMSFRCVTKHLQQSTEIEHFRVKKNKPRIGGFEAFNTARRTIQGLEAMLWLRTGFGIAGERTVHEQNRLLAVCFGLQAVNKS
jgi:IS6 family transposase